MEEELARLQDDVQACADAIADLRTAVDGLTAAIEKAVRVAVAVGGLQSRTRG